LVTLPAAAANVWTSNPGVADVYVASTRQIHLYGKAFGEATVFATNAAGAVVYSANIRVSQNISSIDAMMRAAMPDSDITVTTVGQIAVLNGTVRSPQDSEQAQRLVTGLLNPGVNISDPNASLKIGVVNRLRTATPLQVQLQVRFAEVSRSFVKNLNVNLTNRDRGSFLFGISQGKPGTITTNTGTAADPATGAPPGASIFSFPAPSTGNTQRRIMSARSAKPRRTWPKPPRIVNCAVLGIPPLPPMLLSRTAQPPSRAVRAPLQYPPNPGESGL